MMQPTPTSEIGFNRALTLASVSLYPLRGMGGVSPSMALGVMPTRPALLISVTDTQGCTGWGEVWANFPPRANIHKMHLIEDVIAPKLKDFSFVEPIEADSYLRDALATYFLHIGQEAVFEHILAGLDTALWDLALRSAGRSFAAHLQSPTKAHCYASSINPDDLKAKLAKHSNYGQSHYKLKLGFGDDKDCAFVEEASRTCPTGARIMIDSNQSWDMDHAKHMLTRLERFNLRFAEEPIPANAPLSDWETLARSVKTPLAAGENIYGVESFLAMADAGVQVLQPDVAKWGGISGAMALAKALPDGVELWPHFMGTAVGQIAALSVTAAIGKTSVCEVDVNTNPLRSDLCGEALRIKDGQINLPSDTSLVVAPLPARLKEFTETP